MVSLTYMKGCQPGGFSTKGMIRSSQKEDCNPTAHKPTGGLLLYLSKLRKKFVRMDSWRR